MSLRSKCSRKKPKIKRCFFQTKKNNSEKIKYTSIIIYTLSSYYILLQVLKATATQRKSVVGRNFFTLLHPTTSYYND